VEIVEHNAVPTKHSAEFMCFFWTDDGMSNLEDTEHMNKGFGIGFGELIFILPVIMGEKGCVKCFILLVCDHAFLNFVMLKTIHQLVVRIEASECGVSYRGFQ
jgi:hypothetical protein